MGHDACTSCVSGLLIETWAEFQQSVADDAIAGEKTGSVYPCGCSHIEYLKWRCLSTLDSSCYTAQPALFIATSATQHSSPFHSYHRLKENNVLSMIWMSSEFQKVVRWHFSGVMDSLQSQLQFVLFWDNVNWLIRNMHELLKNDFLDFPC